MDQHFLTPLFSPKSIVVFAGDPEQPPQQQPMAAALIASLKASGFTGAITWMSIDQQGTLSELAQSRADLAIIALPHDQLEPALEIAGRIRCRAALIISAGLPQTRCAALHAIAKHHSMQLLGPNSLGFQRPQLKLNASVAGELAAKGSLGLVSQSGSLTASILDWAKQNGVGFSNVVSLGANTSVDLAQVLDFLANDAQTQSILVYMEGITHARRFMSSLRAAAAVKPVVVMKAGRMPAGSDAALTHSAAIVGADDVFEAALRRAGVVRVRTFTQLFSAARCLASRYRPVGKRLAIITNGGGPGVLAADWTNDIGLEVARLNETQRAALALKLSPAASIGRLIDLSEEASADHYRDAVLACASDSGIDGVLVIYSPKPTCYPNADPESIAKAVIEGSAKLSKPLVACWMGDDTVRDARALLNAKPIPSFRTPESAVDAFGNIASFYQNQQLLQQTPPPLSTLATPDAEGARLLIEGVLAERRRVLTEMESKALLAAFHIPVTRTMLARSATEAMLIASQLGYPVALKIDSPDISHKSDVQGVVLNVMSATQVRDTFNSMLTRVKRAKPEARINGVTIQPMSGKPRGREIYIGLTNDEPFGPVITFGAGGTMIELIADQAMELPPLNQFLAHRLIERARVAETLGHWRGSPPVKMEALEQVLLRVSEMVCTLPQLREMDINPIIVDEDGAVAVDARIVIEHAPQNTQAYGHLAILPYPAGLEREWPMKGGDLYRIRPIHPDDADMLQALVKSLSPQSRYFRFVSSMTELPAKMLARYTLIDYDREMALVAIHTDRVEQDDGSYQEVQRIVGVSRYITNPDQTTCEFSLVVADDFGGQGLGSRLMHAIMDVARAKGLEDIEGLVLSNNDTMLRLMRSLGFAVKPFPEDPDFKLCVKALNP